MNAIVVYDSVAGNTEKIANAIAEGIGRGTKAYKIDKSEAKQLDKISLLVIGSPTYGGRPTEAMLKYLNSLNRFSKDIKVATFDTRLKMKFVKLFGFAADKLRSHFADKGAKITSNPEGFIVKGRNGPLADGEIEKAITWGKSLQKE